MSKHYDEVVDIDDSRVERDIGDSRGRVPHFTVKEFAGGKREQRGVLYVPTPNGMWAAKAFEDIEAAIRWLGRRHPMVVDRYAKRVRSVLT